MLTAEQIKKLINIANPDGFSWESKKIKDGRMTVIIEVICYYSHVISLKYFYENPKSMDYKFFLQKCIEGIYKWQEILIEQNSINITVHHSYLSDEGIELKKVFGYTKGIDQAKEHALIYILENIK